MGDDVSHSHLMQQDNWVHELWPATRWSSHHAPWQAFTWKKDLGRLGVVESVVRCVFWAFETLGRFIGPQKLTSPLVLLYTVEVNLYDELAVELGVIFCLTATVECLRFRKLSVAAGLRVLATTRSRFHQDTSARKRLLRHDTAKKLLFDPRLSPPRHSHLKMAASVPSTDQWNAMTARLSALEDQVSQLSSSVPTINPGDTAWVMTSTALVLLMSLPGLALFYGGQSQAKNVLSTIMQVAARLPHIFFARMHPSSCGFTCALRLFSLRIHGATLSQAAVKFLFLQLYIHDGPDLCAADVLLGVSDHYFVARYGLFVVLHHWQV